MRVLKLHRSYFKMLSSCSEFMSTSIEGDEILAKRRSISTPLNFIFISGTFEYGIGQISVISGFLRKISTSFPKKCLFSINKSWTNAQRVNICLRTVNSKPIASKSEDFAAGIRNSGSVLLFEDSHILHPFISNSSECRQYLYS